MTRHSPGISPDIAEIHEHVVHHTTVVFPIATNLTCLLTAHANANTWSAWAEIVDSGATALSTSFAADDGCIVAILVEDASQASTLYMTEISYGASKVIIGRHRVLTEAGLFPTEQSPRCRGAEVPAGETIYYRCMCATAGSKTLNVHFRYFLH